MKPHLHSILTAMVWIIISVPLVLGTLRHDLVGPCDYVSQFGLLLLTIVIPFALPKVWSIAGFFGLSYGIWVVWGFWRFLVFDPVTKNDIPGMGYLVMPLLWCGIGTLLFALRKWLARRKQKQPTSASA